MYSYHYKLYHGTTLSCVGGIAGFLFKGVIEFCENKGILDADANIDFGSHAVSDAYNALGNHVRLMEKDENEVIGGIIGKTNQCTITKCCNTGNNKLEGFIGKSDQISNIVYSYNVGNVTDGFGTTNVNVSNSYNAGQTTNYGISAGTVTNSYYISGSGNGTQKTDVQMKSVSMPILLNADSTVFLQDVTPNVNKGYPIFNGTFMRYVATNEASNISYHTATLNGNYLNCTPSSVGFEYRTPSENSYTSKTCSSATSKTYQLTNLSEGTEYIVRFWVIENGIKFYGDTVYFTTLACPPVQHISANICQGEYYEFAGNRLTTAGTYRDSFVAVTGCDSIIELVLNIYDTYKYTQFDTINRGESYEFYGQYLTEPGVYNEYIPITNRCNWVQLNLTVIEPAKTMSLSVNDISMGTVEGAGTYAHGSRVVVAAHASPGYYFIKWSDGVIDSTRVIDLISDTSLTAFFAEEILADSSRCLRFKAVDGAATIALTQVGNPNPISLVYSLDFCNTWNNYVVGNVIRLNANDVVYFRATSSNATFCHSNDYYKFVMTGKIAADGNIMSLLSYRLNQTTVPDYFFMHLFRDCNSLVSAPQLPAMTVGKYGYARLFNGCKNLESMPELPANNISQGSYTMMYANCTKLKTVVHRLPANVLATKCYSQMFYGCANITEAPELPATTLGNLCYQDMFTNCKKLKAAPELPATTLKAGCYQNMFKNCSDLRFVPDLNATIFADSCYKEMFKGCSLIRMNSTGTGTPWKIPSEASTSASAAQKWGNDMFSETAGDLQGAPVIGQNYYPVLSVKLSIARNDSSMGTVTGEGYYAQGSNVSISASPAAHHHFVNWSNGSTDAITPITMVSDTMLIANFATDQHIVTVNSNNPTMGNVAGGGLYNYGQNVTLKATPNAHYHFVSWSNGATSASITISISNDTTLTAMFAIDHHIVSAISNNSTKGSVTGGGEYEYGQTATLTAIANEHFHFVSWSNGKTSPTITIPVYGDSTLLATFAGDTYNVTANSNNTSMGTVTGGGTYEYGQTATLIATPMTHFHFVSWSNGATTPTITILPSKDTILTATFAIDQHSITVNANNPSMGNVSGGGTFDYGQNITLTAIPAEHHHFVSWSDGNTSATRSITVGANATYTATFAKDQFTVSATAQNGSISGAGIYDYGTTITLVATPNEHYHLAGWSDGVTTLTRSLTVVSDTTFEALFAIDQFTITVSAQNGSVTGAGTYDYGTTISLVATPDSHYHFANWSDGNVSSTRSVMVTANATYSVTFLIDTYLIRFVNEDGSILQSGDVAYGQTPSYSGNTPTKPATVQYTYQFTGWDKTIVAVTDTVTYKAVFLSTINQYTISGNATNGSVTGGGTYEYGTMVTLTAVPDAHYHFAGWTDGETSAVRSITVTGNANYVAIFEIDRFNVTTSSQNGSISGAGTYDYGATVTLVATPNEHYHFVNWTDGFTTTSRSVTIVSDTSFEAMFAIDQFTITTSSQNGSVTGGGIYDYGTTISLVATPDSHYHFTGWSDGNISDTRSITVTENATYTALFSIDTYLIRFVNEDGSVLQSGNIAYGQTPAYEGMTPTKQSTAQYTYQFAGWNKTIVAVSDTATYKATYVGVINQYTISVSATNGMVTGGGTYEYGTAISLVAIPDNHYHFVRWSDGGTSATRTITVSANTTYTAFFAIDKHLITFKNHDNTLLQSDSVNYGDVPTYHSSTPSKPATAQYTYSFKGWNPVITNVTGDAIYIADFDSVINNYNISAIYDSSKGSVAGCGTFNYGTTVTLSASGINHYHFVNWNNSVTTSTISFVVTGDSVLNVSFAIDEHNIIATSNNDQYGTVTGGGTYEYGSVATITATPNEHYVFIGWSNGSTSPTLTMIVTSDSVITAEFQPISYTVSVLANYSTRGTVTGGGEYQYGSKATVTATPNEGYEFSGWSNGETSNVISFVVEGDTSFTAIFTPITGVEETTDVEYIAYTQGLTIFLHGAENKTVRIFDMTGKLVTYIKSASNDYSFDTHIAGVYVIRIGDEKTIQVVTK